MRKRIFIVAIFCMILLSGLCQKTYAKYILNGNLDMNVYIDKTPPVINITDKDGTKDSFPKTQDDVVKRKDDVTIDTKDNIEIDHNEIRYNPTENNFDDKTPENFDDGKKLDKEGYYEITAIDTSGNKTVIVILIDKSAPNVVVKYYKKNQISSVKCQEKINTVIENGGVVING